MAIHREVPGNHRELVTVQPSGPGVSGEFGERVAAVVSGDEVAEIGEQRAALHAAGGRGG